MLRKHMIPSAIAVLCLATMANAQTAGMLSFQGLIKDAEGNPVNGAVNLEFRIYDAENGGNLVDLDGDGVVEDVVGEDVKGVAATASKGVVSAKFGPVSAMAFDGTPRWLDVRVNGAPLPRMEMATAVASAERVVEPGSSVAVLSHEITEPGSRKELRVDRDFAIDFGDGSPDGARLVWRGGLSGTQEYRARVWSNGALGFFPFENAESHTLALTQEGNVGIGNITPASKLDVTGRVFADEIAFFRPDPANYSVTTEPNALRINGWDIHFYTGGTMILNLGLDGTSYFQGPISVPVVSITGADLAERFPITEEAIPGMVMAIDQDHPGKLCLARGAYNHGVAGIVSGANGLPAGAVLGNLKGNEAAPPIALSGRVWCWCDGSFGPIQAGDMLTTSSTPGHAMKATDRERAFGAVIGKAMTPLTEGKGLVLVLVQPQ